MGLSRSLKRQEEQAISHKRRRALTRHEKYKLQYAKTVMRIRRWRGDWKDQAEINAIWKTDGGKLLERWPDLVDEFQRVL